jgi:hypothetical protein
VSEATVARGMAGFLKRTAVEARSLGAMIGLLLSYNIWDLYRILSGGTSREEIVVSEIIWNLAFSSGQVFTLFNRA